ncbi:MAG TPA: TfoX/Sxy family protein [Mobilitalea sp.]|nr:TfoX/Sxy family protein [Mobilitalea sp.]
MDWEKANQNIADYLEKLIITYERKKKPMFGAPVYFVNDNMWTGVKGGKVFLRLSEDDRCVIQSKCDEIKPFEPRPDFIMKEYVEIPESKLTDEKFISNWLEISYSFVKSLPPKVKKEKKAKLKKS